MSVPEVQRLRMELAQISQWNIGYFISGFIFWSFVTVIGLLFPVTIARIWWLVGTFLIFPVAVGASRLLGADPFSKGNAFGELVGYTHMSVIGLTFPLVLVAFFFFPEALLLVMAIAYCVDFYVMTWAFGTRIFGLHAAFRTVAVTVIWFAFPEWRVLLIPIVVAVAYLVTIVAIPTLRRRWLKLQGDATDVVSAA